MDTQYVKKLTGDTDRQIDYLIKRVSALKRSKTQGKAREYSSFEVNMFEFAAFMKRKGHTTFEVIKTLNLVSGFLADFNRVAK